MRGELERSHGGRALVRDDEQGHRATPLSGAQLGVITAERSSPPTGRPDVIQAGPTGPPDQRPCVIPLNVPCSRKKIDSHAVPICAAIRVTREAMRPESRMLWRDQGQFNPCPSITKEAS